MNRQLAAASKVINAPAKEIYNFIADYRNGHPRILPKEYFLSLEVETGGFGAGTIVQFQMRLLGQIQSFRSLITEPEPGSLLVETDIQSGTPTSFKVESAGDEHHTRLTISTKLKGRNPVEGFFAKILLEKVYRQELDLIATLTERNARSIQPLPTNDTRSASSK